jgi:hypothetical protein
VAEIKVDPDFRFRYKAKNSVCGWRKSILMSELRMEINKKSSTRAKETLFRYGSEKEKQEEEAGGIFSLSSDVHVERERERE